MKRCPQCGRDYDLSMSFCLDDGSSLLYGPSSGIHSTDTPSRAGEPATVMFNSDLPFGEPGTQLFPANSSDNTNAIAVLPFANMSRDDDAEYLSDGLAEELLNVLSRIQGLRVAGRTSSFSFKGKQTTFKEIGQQLNVSSVLEGSVRMAGKRVRISVQLVNVADGYHLWSQTYDRTLDDIFAIQDDIAGSVVEEVRSRLVDAEPSPSLSRQIAIEVADAAKGRAADPEAHRLMLLGRHFASRRTPEDVSKGIECFGRALEIDPQDATCWMEMGFAQHTQAGMQLALREGTALAAARNAAETALRLEPSLAGGHALIARLKLAVERDLRGAEESITHALELDPHNIYVLQAAGYVLRRLGRFEQTVELGQRLLRIDPLNAIAYQFVSQAAFLLGRLDEAESTARKSIEITPTATEKYSLLALILAAKGQIDGARLIAAKEPVEWWRWWATGLMEAVSGDRSLAREALAALVDKYVEFAPVQIAEIYAALGESDEAFRYLEAAIDTDPGVAGILVSPPLRSLHSDRRWEPLLIKLGIPEEYWPKTAV